MQQPFIYMDNNATTAVDGRVLEKMLPFFTEFYGNAASVSHPLGRKAGRAVEDARHFIANSIGADDQEIYFTSGATESLNTAIQGVMNNYSTKGKHLVCIATEHKAVLDTCLFWQKSGGTLSIVPVENDGSVDLQRFADCIREDTVLVAAMMANNETGVIHPVKEMADIVHEKRAIFLCDATQAYGKIPVDVQELSIDILALSAHKCYGPKGVGALYLRRKNPRVSIQALMWGGGHERGVRSGTLNVPGIVGLGEVAQLLPEFLDIYEHQTFNLKKDLEDYFKKKGALIHGEMTRRLPNTISVAFPTIKAEDFIRKNQHRLGISTGSACSSASQLPSHVLKAMHVPDEMIKRTLRFSLGVQNAEEEVEAVVLMINDLLS